MYTYLDEWELQQRSQGRRQRNKQSRGSQLLRGIPVKGDFWLLSYWANILASYNNWGKSDQSNPLTLESCLKTIYGNNPKNAAFDPINSAVLPVAHE
jgi:hypothetical protein